MSDSTKNLEVKEQVSQLLPPILAGFLHIKVIGDRISLDWSRALILAGVVWTAWHIVGMQKQLTMLIADDRKVMHYLRLDEATETQVAIPPAVRLASVKTGTTNKVYEFDP